MKLETEAEQTSIDYPEIERVNDGRGVTSPTRVPLSRYKSKLANATLKIMSSLYSSEEAVKEVDEDCTSDVIAPTDTEHLPAKKTSVVLPPIQVAVTSPTERARKVSTTSMKGVHDVTPSAHR